MLPGDEPIRRSLRFLQESHFSDDVIVSLTLRSSDRSPEDLIRAARQLEGSLGPPLVTEVVSGVSGTDMVDETRLLLRHLPELLDEDALRRIDAHNGQFRKRQLGPDRGSQHVLTFSIGRLHSNEVRPARRGSERNISVSIVLSAVVIFDDEVAISVEDRNERIQRILACSRSSFRRLREDLNSLTNLQVEREDINRVPNLKVDDLVHFCRGHSKDGGRRQMDQLLGHHQGRVAVVVLRCKMHDDLRLARCDLRVDALRIL